ncbi:hypothetical protein TI04_09310 [Achromatium sp. WMS2]|nr:hypothetical protein TI04_09310 [Achromatium sp. WMS2]
MKERMLALRIIFVFSGLLITFGCSHLDQVEWDPTSRIGQPVGHVRMPPHSQVQHVENQDLNEQYNKPNPKPKPEGPAAISYPGTGVFVNPTPNSNRPNVAQPSTNGSDTINFFFENADIGDVVKSVLDQLKVNYVLDPAVRGTVTMDNPQPIPRDLALSTLETLLRMNKSTMIQRDGTYYVMPIASAIQGEVTPQLGNSVDPLPQGYSVRIVQLKYIGAAEMSSILKPLAPENSVVRVDTVRNLMILAASGSVLRNLLETIDTFDVNWIKGLSVGLFKIKHSKLETITKQVEGLTTSQENNPLSGMFRIVPIEAANSLLVVTHQPEYLTQIGTWIQRLDQASASGNAEPTLYVYRVKNGDAASLAQMLGQLFSDGKSGAVTPAARVAPSLNPTSIGNNRPNTNSSALGGNNNGGMGSSSNMQNNANNNQQTVSVHLESGLSIVADTVNNSLLIRATPDQYNEIANALEQLDILPLQVLVEATIIEVTLKGSLRYGLDWFFKASNGVYANEFAWNGNGSSTGGPTALNRIVPGFNWSVIRNAGEVRAVLSALAGNNLVKVLSSPSVMVLDNHTARIQVGQEVPTLTGQTTDTTNINTTVNSVNYKETGVLLTVTPRVTPGGLVIMEVEQIVSDVTQLTSGNINSPTISKRQINSTVAVKNDQVVILGGLIKDTRENGRSGVPGLSSLPVVGFLFKQTVKSSERTELLVILTPKVLRNDQDLTVVTEEFRTKLQGLKNDF